MCKSFECTFRELLFVCSQLIENKPSGISDGNLIVRLEKTSGNEIRVGLTNNPELLDTHWNALAPEAQENNK